MKELIPLWSQLFCVSEMIYVAKDKGINIEIRDCFNKSNINNFVFNKSTNLNYRTIKFVCIQ